MQGGSTNTMKFTVQRKTWANHNEYKGPSRLLNQWGNSCCLGHCALNLGISDLKGHSTPAQHAVTHPEALAKFEEVGFIKDGRDTPFSDEAMRINDGLIGGDWSQAQREAALKQLFAEHDHELEFV